MKILCPYSLANQAAKEKLSMPPRLDHKIGDITLTLNKMGAMANFSDEITESFLNQPNFLNGTHLEVGSAYGNIAIKALQKGCKKYIANDIDLRHLKILAKRTKEIDPNLLKSLELIHGKYPNEVKIKENTIDSILISRVLHYLSPDDIIKTANIFSKILKPNGKIYVICVTPYNKAYSQFVPIFESNKKNRIKYYGYTEKRNEHLNETLFVEHNLSNLRSDLQPVFHFFDLDSFAEYFNDKGLRIERTIYLPYQKDSIFALDGREGVGAIITKD